MSVINKMLRDLEARRAPAGTVSAAVHATAPQRKRSRLLSIGLLGSAAVAATAFGDWPSLLNAKASQTPAPVVLATAADPAVPEPAPPAAPMASAESAVAPSLPAATPAAPTATPAATAAASRALTEAAAVIEPPPAAPTPAPQARPARARTDGDAAPVASARRPVEWLARAPMTLANPAALLSAPQPASAAAAAAPQGDPTKASASIEKRMATLPPAQRAQVLYQQGLELAGSGHGRQALERLQDALKLAPTLVAARMHAASLLLEQGRGAEAEALAQEGLALSGDEPQLATLLARVLADRGDAAGALALLGRRERLGAEGFGLRAGLLSQQGDFGRAQPDYEQALRLQPGNSLWWLGLGVALESQGRLDQARQVYARAQAIGLDRTDLNAFIDQKLQQLN